jgi:prefoldin subunit 5
VAYGTTSTICGGENNRTGESGTQKGSYATVAGGENNVAREDYSFAAGREAYARAEGSFVWGDSSDKFVESLTPDEVVFQASGGVVMWTTNNNSVGAKLPDGDSSWSAASARAVKSNIDPVDPSEVLAGVEDLEVSTWEYDTRRRVTHMGPMAGDFHDAFDLGDDPERISGVDADGVALAAIQGLSAKLDDRDERIADLEAELAKKADRIDALEAENEALSDETEALRAENETLRERLAAVEERLDTIEASSASLASADD